MNKGLKEPAAKPDRWVVVSGGGASATGPGRYARAVGTRVVAVDIADDQLQLARALGLGADFAGNAAREDPVAAVRPKWVGRLRVRGQI